MTSKKHSKKNQSKRPPRIPSQNGHVENNLSKMTPLSNRTWAIWGTFWPIFPIKNTLFLVMHQIAFIGTYMLNKLSLQHSHFLKFVVINKTFPPTCHFFLFGKTFLDNIHAYFIVGTCTHHITLTMLHCNVEGLKGGGGGGKNSPLV